MKRVRPTAARAAHAIAFALALLTLALSLRSSFLFPPLLGVAAATMVSPFFEWTAVPGSLRRVLPRWHALLLVVAGVTAWLGRSMGVLLLEPGAIPAVAAPVLVPVWAAFALAPRAFPAGRTLLPAAVAVLTLAGLNPAPEGYDASVLPFPRDGARNAFAEVYLGLALLVVVVLWVAALRQSGPRWSRRTVLVVAATGVVAVGLAATAIVGLPLFQPRVERAFAAALDHGATGLSGESTLGDIGSLARSRRRVLDLQTSLPSDGAWLLPAEVFTRFDGRRWSNAPAPGRSSAPSSSPDEPALSVTPGPLRPGATPSGAGPLVAELGKWFPIPGIEPDSGASPAQVRVTQARTEEWPLLLPRGPVAVTAASSHLQLDRFGLVRRVAGLPLRQYGAVLVDRVSGGWPGLSPVEREESLALPQVVDPRVASLASSLAPVDSGSREVLAATVHHLQTGYEYSLSPGPFRPDGDPLSEFLFEKRKAYCEYFASAAVVLLRLRGVPARFVKGLSVGPQSDMGGGLHVVRESDAHAWVEAWIPGEGWVEADPTPPGQFESARGAPGLLQQWLEHARAAVAGVWARVVSVGPVAFFRWLGTSVASFVTRAVREPVFWLVVTAVVLAPGAERRLRGLLEARRRARERETEAAAVPADLRSLVRDLERRWSDSGHPRPPSRGLREHASSLCASPPPGARPIPDSLVETGSEIVRVYYEARFGGTVSPPRGAVRRLRQLLNTGC